MSRYVLVVFAAVVCIGLASLLSLPCHGQEFSYLYTQESVGRAPADVLVSVTSITSWEKFRESIQPTFTLTEDQALAAAVPTTTVHERLVESALALKLAAAFPQLTSITQQTTSENSKTSGSTADTKTSGNTSDNGKDTSTSTTGNTSSSTTESGNETTSTGSVSRKPGDVSQVDKPTAPPLAELKPFSILDKQVTKVDPLLLYDSATALYEYVQLKNREILDAAVPPGCKAYIVRLQIAVQPLKRVCPYDAYLSCGFVFGPAQASGGMNVAGNGSPACRETKDAKNTKATVGNAGGKNGTLAEQMQTPRVMPLLVMDDLEATMNGQSAGQSRGFAAEFLAMLQGIGVKLGGGFSSNELDTLLGRDYSSLLNVAQLSDSAIRVRLGANRQGMDGYSLVPRSHTVSLLLIVPDDNSAAHKAISVISDVTFIDPKTGKALPKSGVSKEELLEAFKPYREPNTKEGSDDAETVQTLMSYAWNNDEAGYYKKLGECARLLGIYAESDSQKGNGGSGGTSGGNSGSTADPSIPGQGANGIVTKQADVNLGESPITKLTERVRSIGPALWVDLLSLKAGRSHFVAGLEFPKPDKYKVDGQPTLVDDGKSLVVMAHCSGANNPKLISATIAFGNSSACFVSKSVSATPAGDIQLTFPSAKEAQIDMKANAPKLTLRVLDQKSCKNLACTILDAPKPGPAIAKDQTAVLAETASADKSPAVLVATLNGGENLEAGKLSATLSVQLISPTTKKTVFYQVQGKPEVNTDPGEKQKVTVTFEIPKNIIGWVGDCSGTDKERLTLKAGDKVIGEFEWMYPREPAK